MRPPSAVGFALERAGTNRSELERVLQYYSRSEADSLKLRAAEYLIANMPGHRCLHGPKVDSYYREIYSILQGEERDPQQLMAKLNQIAAHYPIIDSVVRYDIEVITADFLIHNIEQAFQQWKSPTADYLTFNQFCEWLLPYKVAELQPLDYWRDTLSQHFTERLRSDSSNDENYNFPYYRAFWINYEARMAVRPNILPNLAEYKGYEFYGASSIYRLPFGDCFDYTTLAVATLRSHAVPAVFDYLPQWGRGGSATLGSHFLMTTEISCHHHRVLTPILLLYSIHGLQFRRYIDTAMPLIHSGRSVSVAQNTVCHNLPNSNKM